MQQNLFTLSEVSQILRVSKMTVYRYISQGKLKAYKFGKQFRIDEYDLASFLVNASFNSPEDI
jgi:putative molybdopterin biosynthesis protein